MDAQKFSSLFLAFFRTVGYLSFFFVIGLFLDSTYMVEIFPDTQHLATFVMLVVFAVLYFKAMPRLKKQMMYAVVIGVMGEYLLSVGLGMYTYRLGNVPHYVPPGHAIVLVTGIDFCKQSIVKQTRKKLELFFSILILIYATLFLILFNDVFGFVMSILVIYLLRNKPRERLFYFTMYIIVAILELIGTNYGCWYWPETAFGTFDFLKSANPPSGISLFYFLLDLGSLWVYKKFHMEAWSRMKRIRLIRKEQ